MARCPRCPACSCGVETVVSYFHPCDAQNEASARGEPLQIAAVNLPVQQ